MHLGYNAVELPVNTQIGTVAEINRLQWGTQEVIHHHTEPSQQTPTMEDHWTTSLMFSQIKDVFIIFGQMSSPSCRWRLMNALNEQRSTPLLGAASRYPKDLIFNPFTAPACKSSGLKDARTHLKTVCFPVL